MPKNISTRNPTHLPLEILSIIFENLQHHQSVLTNCCRVSKSFLAAAAPILYRKIVISSNGPDSTYGLSDHQDDPTCKINLLRNAEVLTMHYHRKDRCQDIHIDFSKVHTLILVPLVNLNEKTNIICNKDNHSTSSTSEYCSIALSLRPRKIIIHNASLLNSRCSAGLSPEVFKQVEEIICISPTSVSIHPVEGEQLPRMENLKKFTWIFWTAKWYDNWKLTPEDDRCKRRTNILYQSMDHLAWVIFNLPDETEVSIINSGCLQELEWKRYSHEGLQKQTEEGIRRFLGFAASMIYGFELGAYKTPKGIQLRERAEKISQEIKYLTMKEYVEKEKWEDIFEAKEVENWLK